MKRIEENSVFDYDIGVYSTTPLDGAPADRITKTRIFHPEARLLQIESVRFYPDVC